MFSLCQSHNILVVYPHPGKSHFLIYEPLFTALAAKGHNITVISYYPQKKSVPNYRDIVLGDGSVAKSPEFLSLELFQNSKRFKWLDGLFILDNYLKTSCLRGFESENFQQFLKEDNKFDLLLVQYFISECFMGLTKMYGAPYIGMYL